MPWAPVPALALPLLISSASGDCCKWFLATTTGAAQNTFCVNTPAVVVPGDSEITDKSKASLFLIPALIDAEDIPAMFNND